MEIAPRYEGPVIVTIGGEGVGPAVGAACVRQRCRLQATLARLDDGSWRAPSRCDGWTVQDVVAHLDGVNRFWHWSIASGLAGEPTRVLAGFDPKTTPAAMVDSARSKAPAPAETLAALAESSEALCEQVAAIEADQWGMIAEAPAGHIAITALVHHALWDCWIHERDIALPLGLAPVEEPDEVTACLRFVAALGPVFTLQRGRATPALLVVEATEPEARVVVEVADAAAGTGGVQVHDRPVDAAEVTYTLRGRAADLVEALSIRAPLTQTVPDEHAWLVRSLAVAFEST